MNCNELLQVSLVEKAIVTNEDERLLEQIFNCIYQLFYADFIHFVVSKNSDHGIDRAQVVEMAKDAFQEGLYNFYKKTKVNGLEAKAGLKTIINTFGWWQFMAIKKKDKKKINHVVSYDRLNTTSNEKLSIPAIIDISTCHELSWDESLQEFLSEEELKLYCAIRMLPKKKWQQVIMWRYFYNLKPQEIAVKMGVSKEDVENKLSKARKALKEILVEKLKFLT
jgi:RNA polymerase sigma factor (sigma-70 family)